MLDDIFLIDDNSDRPVDNYVTVISLKLISESLTWDLKNSD